MNWENKEKKFQRIPNKRLTASNASLLDRYKLIQNILGVGSFGYVHKV